MQSRHRYLAVLTTFSMSCICTGCSESGGTTDDLYRSSQCLNDMYPAEELSDYILPWQVGETYLVGQGNCVEFGSGSHALGTRAEYAYDIVMPIGTGGSTNTLGRKSVRAANLARCGGAHGF